MTMMTPYGVTGWARGGPNYKACAVTKCNTNQGLQLLSVYIEQSQKVGLRKGSAKGQDKRNEKKTPIYKCKHFAV